MTLSPEKAVFALREAFHKTTSALLTHGHARDILRELNAAGLTLSDAARTEGSRLSAPEGWALLPREPTEEMINAGDGKDPGFGSLSGAIYRAMIAAAPPPADGGEK